MSLYEEFRDYFDPEVRRRKAAASAAAYEAERRERQDALAVEVGAVSASPVIQQYREVVLSKSSGTFPHEAMDAAGAFWFRRGLEHAVEMLDHILATAEENDG